jgi:hypothetical protein
MGHGWQWCIKGDIFFSLTSFLVCHASFSLEFLRWKFWIRFGDGDRPLVFVGHGDGGLVLKQALVKLLDESGSYKDLPSNLCGIVFYGGTNTKLTNKHGPLIRCPLQFKSAHFGRCWPLLDVRFLLSFGKPFQNILSTIILRLNCSFHIKFWSVNIFSLMNGCIYLEIKDCAFRYLYLTMMVKNALCNKCPCWRL